MVSERRRGLGRGLGALIPTDVSREVVSASPTDVFFAEDTRWSTTPADHADASGPGPVRVTPAVGTEAMPATAREAPEPVDVASRLSPVPGATYALVPLDSLVANARQPRTSFDEDELDALAHSIRELGVLQPVVVRPRDGGTAPAGPVDGPVAAPSYEIVMGERRWQACRRAGLKYIPAIIQATPDDAMLRDALLENLHRSQLSPIEEAAAYQ